MFALFQIILYFPTFSIFLSWWGKTLSVYPFTYLTSTVTLNQVFTRLFILKHILSREVVTPFACLVIRVCRSAAGAIPSFLLVFWLVHWKIKHQRMNPASLNLNSRLPREVVTYIVADFPFSPNAKKKKKNLSDLSDILRFLHGHFD